MAPMDWAVLPLLSQEQLCRRATAASIEAARAARESAHWTLQLAYAHIRAVYSQAAAIVVELVPGQLRCHVVQVLDAAGRGVWSRPTVDDARDDQFGGVDELLAEVIRVPGVALLPGWTDRAGDRYAVDLGVLPPALDLDRIGSDLDGADPSLAGVPAVVAGVLDGWFPHEVQAGREYARGLLEGRFAPLTDIAGWPIVPAALGYPVSDEDTSDRLRPDAEDWMTGIASVHGLAAGVVVSRDTGEGYGTENELHYAIYVSDADLADHGLTVRALATAFHGDTRRAAAAILQALPRDHPLTLPVMVPCSGCGQVCVLATAHRDADGWVGAECCWAEPPGATDIPSTTA